MATWRFLKVILAALIVFIVVNFFITNSSTDANSLANQVSFKFNIPPFLYLESIDFAVGYLLTISFTLGMIFAAIIGAINAFSRSRELKMKNKTIRELEIEIDDLRESLHRERNVMPDIASSHVSNYLPEDPKIG